MTYRMKGFSGFKNLPAKQSPARNVGLTDLHLPVQDREQQDINRTYKCSRENSKSKGCKGGRSSKVYKSGIIVGGSKNYNYYGK